ncbi:MAG: hypothetical protein IJL34_01355 [Treponema sp.]|nr:hypothetical protein [Treponema sp.]
MKKFFIKALFIAAVCSAVFFVAGCADANGLHNQEAATVVFEFTDFPAADGVYAIPGEHNSWDNTVSLVTLKDGSGTSSSVKITSTSLEFSLTKVDSWLRLWSKKDGGSINGAGREGADYYRNFLAEGIELGSDVKIIIDGSTETATVTVE